MSPIKQLQVVVLLVITAALLASTRADAATRLTPTDAESGASGEAGKAGKSVLLGREFDGLMGLWWWIYGGELSVRCHGLAPNAAYTVHWESGLNTRSGEFPLATDAFGEGATTGGVNACALSKNGKREVNVSVLDANGTVVLSGTVPF